jgi:hypothetical protein
VKVLIGFSCCPLTAKAMAAHGHDVWTCDLLPSRGWRQHIQCDIRDVLGAPWDFAILHPMCTRMTLSSAWACADPDFEKYPGVGYHQKIKPGTVVGRERREARDSDVKVFKNYFRLPYPVECENPAPSFLNTAFRPPDQRVHPYQFGDDASKGTGFWRSPEVPMLVIDPASRVSGRIVGTDKRGRPVERWANQTDSGQNRLAPSDDRWLDRSATYPGIAFALGDQRGRWLNGEKFGDGMFA